MTQEQDNFEEINNQGGSEFEIDFTDVTILEADGEFKKVSEIMLKDSPVTSKKWMLNSGMTLVNETGVSNFNLNFWYNGDVYIIDYMPSVKDVFYNLDLRCLSYWSQQNGWNVPKVSTDLVKQRLDYWKYFWSVNLVDSDYLDSAFGDRNEVPIDLGNESRP